jgi:hypothetical protein
MPSITNNSPCAVQVFSALDSEARESRILVVSAAYEARPGESLRVADEPPVVRVADEYRGDPACTSILHPSDSAPEKPHVDVLVVGAARPPRGRSARVVAVRLRVADIDKRLRVCGDRYWRLGVPSLPARFTSMPILWERAFGGTRPKFLRPKRFHYDARNPVGLGLRGARSPLDDVASELPNVEYPHRRMRTIRSRPAPAGFGAISPGWAPRVRFAGTYDARWLERQSPLLPKDFDPRFHQVAPADQQSRTLRGGEAVEILGMTPEGRWRFELPRLDVPVRLLFDDRRAAPGSLRLDTVLLEPDLYRVTLTARMSIPVVRNQAPLREVVVGEVRHGWWRSRLVRKRYRVGGGFEDE